jgi:predicted RNase H-like nuclease
MKIQHKDVRAVVRAAERSGWVMVEKARGIQLRSPDGVEIVTVHLTLSDHRAIKNLRADLKRRGVKGV